MKNLLPYLPMFFGVLTILCAAASAAAGDPPGSGFRKATFAGGCFWCMEKPFEKLDGVISVTSGYTYGAGENPTYNDYGDSGHIEAVEIVYDPARISYWELLEVYWHQIDPTDASGQFADRGHPYTTAIFYHDEAQRQEAEKSKELLENSDIFDKPLVTPILPAKTFYRAEDYHQDYYKKNPLRYNFYRRGSGRDRFLEKVWQGRSFPSREDRTGHLEKLTPLQYEVTRKNGTEPPFANEYWDNKEPGIYVDIVSGEPLFGSTDKYDSGTGWPSFTKPLVPENIVEKEDRRLVMPRTEVRSKKGDSHLGHVFKDGPPPTGLRYCLNSAALRFIAAEDLAAEGYEAFAVLFEKPAQGTKSPKDDLPGRARLQDRERRKS